MKVTGPPTVATEMTKLRILVLASTYPRWSGDPEPGFVHELCRRLAPRFDVVAVVPDAADADPSGMLDGVRVIRYRYAPRRLEVLVNDGGIATNLRRSPWKWLLVPGFVIGQYRAARRITREWPVDVVHAHWLLPQGLVATCIGWREGLPYLLTAHGGDLFGLRGLVPRWFKREVSAGCAAMTVVSHAMRDEAVRTGLHPPRLEVLPMGVDLQGRFVPDERAPRSKDELLFVGRLVAKKGLRYLLDAMPRVLAVKPGSRLILAGFGPEEAALRAQAADLGIADRVVFRGATPQAELPTLYRRAAVFVAPFVRDPSGDQEGLSVALMEALGCDCPVVVGNVAGVHDLLGEAAGEVAVDPRDPVALSTKILGVLENPAAANQRARELRSAIVARVDWQYIADAYAELIKSCVRKHAAR